VARAVAAVARHPGIDEDGLPRDVQLEPQRIVVAVATPATQSHATDIGEQEAPLMARDIDPSGGKAAEPLSPRGRWRSVRGTEQPHGCGAFREHALGRDAQHRGAERQQLPMVAGMPAVEHEHARAIVVTDGGRPPVRPHIGGGVVHRVGEPLAHGGGSGAAGAVRRQHGQQAQLGHQTVIARGHLVIDPVGEKLDQDLTPQAALCKAAPLSRRAIHGLEHRTEQHQGDEVGHVVIVVDVGPFHGASHELTVLDRQPEPRLDQLRAGARVGSQELRTKRERHAPHRGFHGYPIDRPCDGVAPLPVRQERAGEPA